MSHCWYENCTFHFFTSYGLRFKTISYTDLKNSNFNQREPPLKNNS